MKYWEVYFFVSSEDDEPVDERGGFATEADALEYAQEVQDKTGWGYETMAYWELG